jgi:flagellar export protein FliJ
MPSRYVFRFETLLRIRKQHEDQAKRVVAARLREIHTIEERQRALQSTLDEQSGAMRQGLQEGRMDVETVRLGRHWLLRLRRGALELQSQLLTQKALLAHERAELLRSRKDAEVLGKLRDRQYQVFQTGLNRAEQLELDDLNIARATRNRK